MQYTKTALEVLKETSRTFYIPIVKLPAQVQKAVASAYLCLRAIDEVEDHASLTNPTKADILRSISYTLQTFSPESAEDSLRWDWHGKEGDLPEVTLRLAEWIFLCPAEVRARVVDCTATMADRMAWWAARNWRIDSEQDLDVYTFAVAGAVGLILCEIWEWFEGIKTNRSLAIGYGRALQSINILRNSGEDKERGVSFYPPGWTQKEVKLMQGRCWPTVGAT